MKPGLLKIRVYGDPCLREKSLPVQDVGPSERMLIKSMIATMYESSGVGLAAPQVGINQQILVADIGEGPLAIINPKVISKKGSACMEEGCLSLPGIVVNVKRPQTIVLKYIDENNQTVEREFTDLMARVCLHEMDHLEGKLIEDYAGIFHKIGLRRQLKEVSKDSPII